MVCAASRIGLRNRWKPSLRAATIPTGIAKASESATATATWLRVSMEMSHMPRTPTPARPRNDIRVRPIRRETRQASSAAPPLTIHQGTPRSKLRSGSSRSLVIQSLMSPVHRPNVVNTQSLKALVGAATETVQLAGKSCCRSTCRPTTMAITMIATDPATTCHRGNVRPNILTLVSPRRRTFR